MLESIILKDVATYDFAGIQLEKLILYMEVMDVERPSSPN